MDRSITRRLHAILGGWPDSDAQVLDCLVDVRPHSTVTYNEMVVEQLKLPCTRYTEHAPDRNLPAVLCKPTGAGPFPVVLYCHAHGNNYVIGKQELLDGRPALSEGPYASMLVQRGMAALAIDLPCFGERRSTSESSLSKRLLWHGDTLFGTMLRELASAIDYLESRADIDSNRLAAYGVSMGATLSWWLGALDERVGSVAEICCFADLATLIALNGHDEHGIYMTVPGLLPDISTAAIAALMVPRPHFCAVGELDSLTPPAAVKKATEALAQSYRHAGALSAWQLLIEPGSAHVETLRMRRAVLSFLEGQLLKGKN